MTTRIPVDRSRSFRMAGVLVGLAVVLGACAHHEEVTASIPDDYRQRHPIAIQEADRSVVIFVGHGRGGLSASERSDVMGLAQSWLHEGTGTIVADVPVNTSNAAAAADAFREITRCSWRPACRRAGSSSTAIIRMIRARWRRSG